MGRGIVMRDTQRYDEDHEDQMAIRAEEHGELIGRQQGVMSAPDLDYTAEFERQLHCLEAAQSELETERDRNLLAAKYLCTMYMTITGEPRENLMAEAFTAADKALAEKGKL